MQAATKIFITIPEDHRIELTLPPELPAGPAEVIVLVPSARDLLSEDEAQLDAAAQVEVERDSRFRADGGLLVFTGEIPPDLQDALDHRIDRAERLDNLS